MVNLIKDLWVIFEEDKKLFEEICSEGIPDEVRRMEIGYLADEIREKRKENEDKQ